MFRLHQWPTKGSNCSTMTSVACADPPSPQPPLPPHLHSATQPTPTLTANHVTASRPCVRPSPPLLDAPLHYGEELSWGSCLLWRANCLPPPFSFYRRGWVPLLDMGASCSDPASGVTSPTVWEASHVTHHCIATPSARPRALSHTAALSGNVLNIFTVHSVSVSEDDNNMENFL